MVKTNTELKIRLVIWMIGNRSAYAFKLGWKSEVSECIGKTRPKLSSSLELAKAFPLRKPNQHNFSGRQKLCKTRVSRALQSSTS